MNLLDILIETFQSLTANKARTALTILGVVVGIASVIALVSVGQGSTSDIESSIQDVGSNMISISSRSQGTSGDGLTDEDLSLIKSLNGVEAIAPEVSSSVTIVAGDSSSTVNVYGVDENYLEVNKLTMSRGAFINDYSNTLVANVVVLGPELVTDLWEEDYDPVGEQIRIDGRVFTVIGVTKSKGGTGMSNTDELAYVPLTTAQATLVGNKGSYTGINVEAASEDDMEQLTDRIEATLMVSHGISDTSDADFSVMSQSDLLDMASSISGTMTTLLAAIASISLLVGGIGIMNMMLTSVTERIREIGLRKTVGATPGNITLQFLIESIVLTLLGGVIGAVVGIAASVIVNATGLSTTKITLMPILLAVGVCMLIGIVFGFYPARRAAKLDPIEALRYQ